MCARCWQAIQTAASRDAVHTMTYDSCRNLGQVQGGACGNCVAKHEAGRGSLRKFPNLLVLNSYRSNCYQTSCTVVLQLLVLGPLEMRVLLLRLALAVDLGLGLMLVRTLAVQMVRTKTLSPYDLLDVLGSPCSSRIRGG